MRDRVLVLTDREVTIPRTLDGLSPKEIESLKTEYDVVTTLERLGHEPRLLCLVNEPADLRDAVADFKPQIVFNLLEGFRGLGINLPYILGYLELIRQPYTGCNPYGLMLADNKTLMKRILLYHRIPVPEFAIFPRRRPVQDAGRLPFPLIVKSATEHGSIGIAQASVVHTEESLRERVQFIHEQLETDAIAEAYIEGRELYVGILGNRQLQALPTLELVFKNLPASSPRIRTQKMKWDLSYKRKIGAVTELAADLPDGTEERIQRLCKQVYRILSLSGYARMDVRLTGDGKVFLLEPNPNAELTRGEDFSEAARAAGVSYDGLVERIVRLGFRYHRDRMIVW